MPDETTVQPFEGYDNMTVGNLMRRFVNMDDDGRARALRYERKRRNRKQVIWVLVNWNS